jgi:hypothetical protein
MMADDRSGTVTAEIRLTALRVLRCCLQVPDPAAAWTGASTTATWEADFTPLVAVSLPGWGHVTRAHLHNREPSIHI